MTLREAEFPNSSIRRASYDPASQSLTLEFRSGRSYRYQGVPGSVYDWLVRAKSKGAFVTRLIKDRYPYRDVTRSATDLDLDTALAASLETIRREKTKGD